MEIDDIQVVKGTTKDLVEISFGSCELERNVLKIVITENDLRQLHQFWKNNFSYAATKNKKE